MRVIIAGSRGITDMGSVIAAIQASGFKPSVVISGMARGVDILGKMWADDNGIPVETYPADWNRYGKSAGYRRNEVMADKAEALLAIYDGVSRGTKHMIDIATRKGLKVYVYLVSGF